MKIIVDIVCKINILVYKNVVLVYPNSGNMFFQITSRAS